MGAGMPPISSASSLLQQMSGALPNGYHPSTSAAMSPFLASHASANALRPNISTASSSAAHAAQQQQIQNIALAHVYADAVAVRF